MIKNRRTYMGYVTKNHKWFFGGYYMPGGDGCKKK